MTRKLGIEMRFDIRVFVHFVWSGFQNVWFVAYRKFQHSHFRSIVENEIRSNHGLKYLIDWLESGCAIDIHAQGAVAWLSSLNPLGKQQENVVVSNSVTVQGSRAIWENMLVCLIWSATQAALLLQTELVVWFHFAKLEFVGKTCSIAFLVNRNKAWGRLSSTLFQIRMLFLEMFSEISCVDAPWTSSEKRWFSAATIVVLWSSAAAFVTESLDSISLSKLAFSWVVSSQIWCSSGRLLFLRRKRFFSFSFSLISSNDEIPNPHFFFDNVSVSLMQAEEGGGVSKPNSHVWITYRIQILSDPSNTQRIFFQVVNQIGVYILVQYFQFQLSSDWNNNNNNNNNNLVWWHCHRDAPHKV